MLETSSLSEHHHHIVSSHIYRLLLSYVLFLQCHLHMVLLNVINQSIAAYICYREDSAYNRYEPSKDLPSEYADHYLGLGWSAEDEEYMGAILQHW